MYSTRHKNSMGNGLQNPKTNLYLNEETLKY